MPSSALIRSVMVVKLPRIPRLDQLEVERPGAPPRTRDWILAAVLAVLVVIEVGYHLSGAGDGNVEWSALSLITAAVTLAVLPSRRIRPVAAMVIAVAVGTSADIATTLADIAAEPTFGEGIGAMILIYAVCRWAPLRSALAALAIAAVLVFITNTFDDSPLADNIAFVVVWAVFGLAAIVMRYRARVASQQEVQIRLEERQDLARELHDTVAHHVSAIAVQAQAAQFIAANDPAAAVNAMKAVEDIANTTIDEMRRMVGILRSDDDRARGVTGSITELADPTGSPRVSVDAGGVTAESLPSPIAAAVFRITQESITNARRHSRGVTYVDVNLSRTDDGVAIMIVNDGAPTTRNSGGGYGLIGMHERVDALNGTLDVGARAASGWQVHATIPVRRGPDASVTDMNLGQVR